MLPERLSAVLRKIFRAGETRAGKCRIENSSRNRMWLTDAPSTHDYTMVQGSLEAPTFVGLLYFFLC